MNTVHNVAGRVAAIGLGGNLGDPVRAMADALQMIDRREDCAILSVSSLYKTPPWGKIDQAAFFNSCALVETTLAPQALLELCLSIEKSMKRVRTERWGPRTIDIDLLVYDDEVIDEEGLQVPHPRMTQRGFVLLPLAQIAPDLKVDGRLVSDWINEVDLDGIEPASSDGEWWRR